MRKGFAAAACLSLLMPVLAHANYDGVDSYEEYSKRIQAAEGIAPLTDSVFGDQVSLYNGATTFRVTDVSIPGNNELPVALSRMLVIQDLRKQPTNGDGLKGVGDWSLDVPYIDGTFTQQNGWTLYSATPGSTNRCSDNTNWPYTRVPIPGGSGFVPYGHVWDGNELHIPGSGSQVLLANNQPKSYAYTNGAYTGSSVWKWVTTGNWKLRCISSVSNLAGEGFKAVSPTGISYTFDYAVTRNASPVMFRYNTSLTPIVVSRVRIFLLATHVEDRFGNWVNYSYSGDHLTGITSSDGRSITLTWSGDKISSVSSALGTWTYGYATASWTNQFGAVFTWPYLSSVTRPDGSKWTYTINSGSLITNKNDWPNNEPINNPSIRCQTATIPNSGAFQYTVGAPSGASAAYSFMYDRQYRSMVPKGCVNDPTPNHDYPLDATAYFDNFYLTGKQISGPGLPTETWTYDYGGGTNSYFSASAPWINIATTEPYEPPGSCPACAVSKVVTVTGPASITKYTYGVQYARNEGQLLQTQVTDLSHNVLKTTTYTYVSDAQAPSQTFPDIAGYDLRPAYMDPMGNRNRPVAKTVITQDGVTFTTDVSAFDVLARATGVTESSSLGSRTTAIVHADNPWLWTLGQPLSQSVNGTVASQTDYNSQAEPVHTWKFGKLVVTRAHNPDGTLASVTDGNNHATTLSNWKRGIPQAIGYADGTSESAAVNDAGWITSVTDENGFATSYGYDAMGRLASITYPSGDDVAWNPTTISFEQVNGNEYNLSAGHWRQTITTGNAVTQHFYDAFWRPVITKTKDAADSANTISHVVTRYDAEGRLIFKSVPMRGLADYLSPNTGIHTSYDALDRVTQVQQDSELGLLTTTTQYLSGFQTKVTDPRGYATTTSYQTWGEPATDSPVSVTAPEGQLTVIMRDAFGKPLSITRTGTAAGSPQVTRYYVYDTFQQLCKRIDPESGATAFGYDNGGNLAWSAAGLNLLGTTTCDVSAAYGSGRRADRTWDARNRLATLAFPNGNGNQTWSYYPDGLPKTATANNSGGIPTQDYYEYDKRRLLTREVMTVSSTWIWTSIYTHDANGHLASEFYPNGLTVAYAPNALGQPTQVGSYATGAHYNPDGTLAGFTYGNGIVHGVAQNARLLPSSLTDTGYGVTPVSQSYAYDADGNPTTLSDAGNSAQSRSMSYDGLDRLAGMNAASMGGQYNYSYDVLDNLSVLAHIGGSANTYHYDAGNRLASITNPSYPTTALTWDVQGNLATKGGQGYSFDYGNRLRSVAGKELYSYDAWGHRVQSANASVGNISSVYSRDGRLLFQKNDRDAVSRDYLYLGRQLVAIADYPYAGGSSVRYQHTDYQGTVVAQTNASRTILSRSVYDSYGATPDHGNDDQSGYTGHVQDSLTGLTYMQQRYYDPALARFVSVDPVGVDTATGTNFNRYWYANDNPYRYTDPDGRCADGFSCDQMVQSYGAYAEAHPSTELSPLAKVGLTAMLTASGVDEVAIAGKAISSVAKVLRVAKVASNVAKVNKISHIFSQERHNLAGVAKALGGESKAFKAIEKATGKAVDASKPGRFETTVKVGGEHVTVRGSVVNGQVKIGTAFVKKKLEQ